MKDRAVYKNFESRITQITRIKNLRYVGTRMRNMSYIHISGDDIYEQLDLDEGNYAIAPAYQVTTA